MLVPKPPGGGTDFAARLYAEGLTRLLGQPVVIENRPCANGNLAIQAAARTTLNDDTILLQPSKAAPFQPSTAWCGGGCAIWGNGSGKNSGFRSPSRPSAASCAPWVCASSRPARSTMPRRPRPSRHSKNFPTALAGIAADQGLGLDAVEIWFADKARIGQKNKITRRWARRGTRPSAPQNQRTASTYIFGAVCPRKGKGAALVLPFCNTAGMSPHLAEIARMVEPGRHAVLLLDQAGWHLSADVEVAANITVLPLPAKCPELNVMENVW